MNENTLLFARHAEQFSDRVAVVQGNTSVTYRELLRAARSVATQLLNGRADLLEDRVAFLVYPGPNYVATMWGIWLAGGIAVPLSLDYPEESLRYVLEDTEASQVVASGALASKLEQLAYQCGLLLHVIEEIVERPASHQLPTVSTDRRAMILYTSGTTSKPKGVVSTHATIQAQISTLIDAWQWRTEDHTLCVLPLHHVHGIINVVGCSLWKGACCEFPESSFHPAVVFDIFKRDSVSVFMAVPTIYFKLIAYWEQLPSDQQQRVRESLQRFRLMVCGSAALPVTVMEKWEAISGHRLLERYGMTEIGMAISNPYRSERRAGHVGQPLPGVDIRLCDEHDHVLDVGPGEIQVKGLNVFREYWRKEEATKAAFTTDGWFRTGDVAELVEGYYRILGRSSIDIIKSGGYKISAIEIEEVLRQHEGIVDCGVVGLPNDEWGELVAAAYVGSQTIRSEELTEWLSSRLPRYKLPRIFQRVEDLPRNAMGKVVKQELKKLFIK